MWSWKDEKLVLSKEKQEKKYKQKKGKKTSQDFAVQKSSLD